MVPMSSKNVTSVFKSNPPSMPVAWSTHSLSFLLCVSHSLIHTQMVSVLLPRFNVNKVKTKRQIA